MTDFALHRRAQAAIAQAYLTNSKRPESLVKGVYPTHVARGQGAYLWDHSGVRYLDWICGLGTNLLGYGNERVADELSRYLRGGFSHSLGTHHEIEAAERLKELFPFVDAVKFLKTGSEACSAAIRIARAATGREIVLSEGYHGWSDPFVSLTPPALGVPSAPLAIERYRDDYELGQVAAVIIEPVITDHSPERLRWVQALRERCSKAGTLLIFDEVITGFRFPKLCFANWSGITPDLIVLGKAVGAGLPIAAVGGKYAVMNAAEYFVSSTYAGEVLSLVAAKTVMGLLQTPRYDLHQLWYQGERFQHEFNSLWPEGIRIEGYPSRGVLVGDARALFMQEACKAGMLFGPSWFISFAHADEWRDSIGALRAITTRIRNGEVKLEGEPPQSPFAQKVRENR